MASLSYDCPHCGTKRARFESFASHREAAQGCWSMHGKCDICFRGVVFHLIQRGSGHLPDPHNLPDKSFGVGGNNRDAHWTISGTSPAPREQEEIAHLPESVAKPLAEAESSFAGKNFSAAAVMYRKAIERSVRAIDPESKGTLNQRIRALEKGAALPHALIELMDMVKFMGNEGAHEDDDPTEKDVKRGRDFARLLLTYLWTLPEQVKEAKNADSTKDKIG